MEDAFFKSAFSHVRVIELLLRSQVPEWADKIDFSSLQRLSGEFVDDELRHRYADRVWRGRSIDAGTVYMLVLEFQGRPERHMALRTTVYSGLAGLSTAQDMRAELRALLRVVRVCEDEDLDQFLTQTVKALLRSKGMSGEELEEATTMQTVVTAFERSLDEIRQEGHKQGRKQGIRQGRKQGIRQGREQGIRQGREQGIRQGRKQGIRQGREQGIEQGRVSVLRELAARKFGPAVAEELVSLLDRAPDPERVARATEALLDCDSAEDFVKRVREA